MFLLDWLLKAVCTDIKENVTFLIEFCMNMLQAANICLIASIGMSTGGGLVSHLFYVTVLILYIQTLLQGYYMISLPLLQLNKFSIFFVQFSITHRVEAGIMRQMVLWDTACNFNGFISNQSIFNCLITGASTLLPLYVNSQGMHACIVWAASLLWILYD